MKYIDEYINYIKFNLIVYFFYIFIIACQLLY